MAAMISNAAEALHHMTGDAVILQERLVLRLPDQVLALESNSKDLLDELRGYFAHVVDDGAIPEVTIRAIEAPANDFGLIFRDWAREEGKKGRKDAIHDLADARLVQKVRTGMLFLQHAAIPTAHGPCCAHPNQVINFINAQYMNHLQQQDALICHASGLVLDGKCVGMAGLSGGGKSTLMLRLLDDERIQYLTNDRLFLQQTDDGVDALGIPKLPRINPGTIVHNPVLQPLIPAARRQELLALPQEELWQLEEKHDVDVAALYGPGRIAQSAKMKAFIILNWSRESHDPCHMQQVDLEIRHDLIKALMKSPGPFYQFADGRWYQDDMIQNPADWVTALGDTAVFEISGGIDFDAAAKAAKSALEAL